MLEKLVLLQFEVKLCGNITVYTHLENIDFKLPYHLQMEHNYKRKIIIY